MRMLECNPWVAPRRKSLWRKPSCSSAKIPGQELPYAADVATKKKKKKKKKRESERESGGVKVGATYCTCGANLVPAPDSNVLNTTLLTGPRPLRQFPRPLQIPPSLQGPLPGPSIPPGPSAGPSPTPKVPLPSTIVVTMRPHHTQLLSLRRRAPNCGATVPYATS